MIDIEEVGIIGAGVMGSAIAALVASAGVRVVLLDIDPALARQGIVRQQQLGALSSEDAGGRVLTGSSVDDLALLAGADWIIEAAAESLAVKQHIFAGLNSVRKPGSILSSNTSTLPLEMLAAPMEPHQAADLLITHFFNPPSRMRLMELVDGLSTRSEASMAIARFAEDRLGRKVARAKDRPGFIANRIGNFWMAAAIESAVAAKLDVEEADALINEAFGTSVGIFSLVDLLGIDLLPTVWKSLQSALPADDAIQAYDNAPPIIAQMIAAGRYGRKSGAGFTRRLADHSFEVLDLHTGDYRPRRPVRDDAQLGSRGDLRQISEHGSRGSRFVAEVLARTVSYATGLVPEIAETAEDVDLAMREGYGWRAGPFELVDRLGAPWFLDLLAELGIAAPPYLARAGFDTGVPGTP